ncbi:MAG: peptide ABC transporter permease, partial [Mesorhizobium sp.]
MTALVANAGQGRWWRSRTVRRFTSHHLALLGVAMITLLTLACVFGPHLLPYDSLYIDLRARFSPPLTGHHYLGTDPLGRDLAARLLMAGRISLAVAF